MEWFHDSVREEWTSGLARAFSALPFVRHALFNGARASAIALAWRTFSDIHFYFNCSSFNTSVLTAAVFLPHPVHRRNTSRIPLKLCVSSSIHWFLLRISRASPSRPFRHRERSHDSVTPGAVGLQPSGDGAGISVAGEGIDRDTAVVSVAAVRWWRWPQCLVVNGACWGVEEREKRAKPLHVRVSAKHACDRVLGRASVKYDRC